MAKSQTSERAMNILAVLSLSPKPMTMRQISEACNMKTPAGSYQGLTKLVGDGYVQEATLSYKNQEGGSRGPIAASYELTEEGRRFLEERR